MLTDTELRKLKPTTKAYKRFDGGGLYVLVNPDGSKWWRLKYVFGGREKLISLGTYPDTSLKLARKQRGDARQLLAADIDPSARRQEEKSAEAETFQDLATEWLAAGCPGGRGRGVDSKTVEQLRRRLKTYVFPFVGRWPIADITAPELLKVLRRIELRGTFETARRVRNVCSRVFRYAIAVGKGERDPAGDLIGAVAAGKPKNYAALTDPKEVGALLRALDEYRGQPTVAAALKLAPLLFVRPGELRAAEWVEFDLSGKDPEWRIPGTRMKMGEQHIVPLPRQAVAIIEDLRTYSGPCALLFPSLRTTTRPISDNTLNAALRRLGYRKDQQTAHGFRTIASTLLNELGVAPDLIEKQLAHAERNKVRAAYNRAERLAERRKMMQRWADYLDRLKAGAVVLPLHAKS